MKHTIEELRRLHEAATPRPWQNEPDTQAGRVWVQRHSRKWWGTRMQDVEPLFQVRDEDNYEQRAVDAALITAMRNSLPALLDVAEAAIKVGDVIDPWNDHKEHADGACEYCDDNWPCRVERLRTALARLDGGVS